MGNNENNLLQEQLDTQFQQQSNVFYDSIKTLLKEQFENGDLLKYLDNCVASVKEMTDKQYQVVGALAYLFGVDFSNQQYLKYDIVDKVRKRFEDVFGETFFSDENQNEILNKFDLILSTLREEKLHDTIVDAKNKFSNNLAKTISDKAFGSFENKKEMRIIFEKLKALYSESVIKLNICVDAENIFAKKFEELTYHDILKINSIVTQNLKFYGSSTKYYKTIYSSKAWIHIIQKCVKLFDNQKYAIIYYDSILTFNENFEKLFGSIEISSLLDIFFLKEEYFNAIEEDFNTQISVEEEKTEDIVEEKTEDIIPVGEYKSKYDNVEIQRILQEDPDEGAAEIFRDIMKSNVFDNSCVMNSIAFLFDNLDYASQLYSFFKASQLSPKRTYDFGEHINYSELRKDLDSLKNELNENYKKVAELSCTELPKDKIQLLTKLIDNVIDNIVLDSIETKQYLISQKIANSITTHNHLQQFMQLLDNCEISCSGAIHYVKLHNYVTSDNEITSIFEQSKGMENLTTQLRIVGVFNDWFKKKEDYRKFDNKNQK